MKIKGLAALALGTSLLSGFNDSAAHAKTRPATRQAASRLETGIQSSQGYGVIDPYREAEADPYANVDPYAEAVEEDSVVDEKLINYVIFRESRGNPKIKDSRKGARGLMQVMPATWKEETRKMYGKSLPFEKAHDAKINREVGIHYLHVVERYLAAHLPGWKKYISVEKKKRVLAGYNGGMGNVVRKGGDVSKTSKESRDYAGGYNEKD